MTDGARNAAALGDGTVQLFGLSDAEFVSETVVTHEGACLALVPDVDGEGFLSGGQDGRLQRIVPGCAPETLADVKGRWIEHVDAHPQTRLRAYAVGRQVVLLNADGWTSERTAQHRRRTGFWPRRKAAGGRPLWRGQPVPDERRKTSEATRLQGVASWRDLASERHPSDDRDAGTGAARLAPQGRSADGDELRDDLQKAAASPTVRNRPALSQ